jgi:tetratricopeptide (TPR) repeat protein
MASLIQGFHYDVFISYRQKDNKHDGWVTEFVDNLKGELESTFKEEISVYFDINPHDGLLETHDVDASLQDKLKCLVFIPILSRTYCDPKSFAWEHEFKAFVEQASKDQFGLKVKLPNGNVANRVLPIRIHDLDYEDVKSYEGFTSGVMRTLDFVFKTASGVNRPLKSNEDHPGDNINKTYYQDQINKVALAIKEIIQGMKMESSEAVKKDHGISNDLSGKFMKNEEKAEKTGPEKSYRHMLVSGALIFAFLIIVAVIAYLKIFRRDTLEKLQSTGKQISVAVMPFQNMTNDTTWNIWQEGIKDILINSLSNSGEFIVRQSESVYNLTRNQGNVNYASLTPALARTISQKLDANVFICGNIKQAGSIIRLYAQLIDTKTVEVFRSFQVEGSSRDEMIFNVIDSLSSMIGKFLIISELQKELPSYQNYEASLTSSPEALRYFIYGRNEFMKLRYPEARKWLAQAISLDSNFVHAIIQLSLAYGNQDIYDKAKKICMKAFEKRDKFSGQLRTRINWIHAKYFETPEEQIDYLNQLVDFDDQNPITYFNLGASYSELFQYDKAIPEYEKALEIHKKWGTKPFWVLNYTYLATAYHKNSQFKKERKLYEKAEHDFPGERLQILRSQAILALDEGDTIEVNKIRDQALALLNSNSVSEAQIMTALASVYSDADNNDTAEKYYRQAYLLEPENPVRINDLAYFLIDKERNINEGMELINKALEFSPDQFNYLHTKGWGLYKQGKFDTALLTLQKSWDLRMKEAIYDHEAFIHLEEAKKTVAGQKN